MKMIDMGGGILFIAVGEWAASPRKGKREKEAGPPLGAGRRAGRPSWEEHTDGWGN
jgi:hypothetical protein